LQEPEDEEQPEQSPYEARAAEHDAEYRREYAAWYASLPNEERQLLKKKGLHRALIDYHASESDRDITERNLSQEPDDQVFAVKDSEKRIWEVVEGIAILIIDAEKIRLEADTLAFMAGFYTRMGISGTELGAKYGLTRAAWSKRCKHLQRKLGLPPSRSMKSEEACRVYAGTNGAMKNNGNGRN
jgi:hypothetical protein